MHRGENIPYSEMTSTQRRERGDRIARDSFQPMALEDKLKLRKRNLLSIPPAIIEQWEQELEVVVIASIATPNLSHQAHANSEPTANLVRSPSMVLTT